MVNKNYVFACGVLVWEYHQLESSRREKHALIGDHADNEERTSLESCCKTWLVRMIEAGCILHYVTSIMVHHSLHSHQARCRKKCYMYLLNK